jgi:hypothetical protein
MPAIPAFKESGAIACIPGLLPDFSFLISFYFFLIVKSEPVFTHQEKQKEKPGFKNLSKS